MASKFWRRSSIAQFVFFPAKISVSCFCFSSIGFFTQKSQWSHILVCITVKKRKKFEFVFWTIYVPEGDCSKFNIWATIGPISKLFSAFYREIFSIREYAENCFSVLWRYFHKMDLRAAIYKGVNGAYMRLFPQNLFVFSSRQNLEAVIIFCLVNCFLTTTYNAMFVLVKAIAADVNSLFCVLRNSRKFWQPSQVAPCFVYNVSNKFYMH